MKIINMLRRFAHDNPWQTANLVESLLTRLADWTSDAAVDDAAARWLKRYGVRYVVDERGVCYRQDVRHGRVVSHGEV